MNTCHLPRLLGLVLGLLLASIAMDAQAQGRLQRFFERIQQQNNGNMAMNAPENLGELRVDNTPPIDEQEMKKIVKPLINAIKAAKNQPALLQIAVFPFGNNKGEIDSSYPDSALELQGALVSSIREQLKRETPGRFVLLDKFALKRMFGANGVAPASIGPGNENLSKLLRGMKIDIAVVGTIGGQNYSMSIVFAEPGTPRADVKSQLGTSDIQTGGFLGMQKRIGVSLQCRPPNNPQAPWQPISIVQDKEIGNVSVPGLFAVIEPNQQNWEYRVLVANRGFRQNDPEYYLGDIVNPDNSEERNRLFGVAVMIDGVNSFYEDTGSGQLGAVAIHPRDAKKWLIGPQGYLIVPGPNGSPRISSANNRPDHSTVSVAGFQDGVAKANAFQLAPVGGNGPNKAIVAEALGITESIGLISVFIFSEKLLGDKSPNFAAAPGPGGAPKIGTAAGRQFSNPVVNLKVDFHRPPVEQFHFYYRLRADMPFPSGRWQVVSGR